MDYTSSIQKYAALVAQGNAAPYAEKFAAFSRTYAQTDLYYKTAGLQAFADNYTRELQTKQAAFSFRNSLNAVRNSFKALHPSNIAASAAQRGVEAVSAVRGTQGASQLTGSIWCRVCQGAYRDRPISR